MTEFSARTEGQIMAITLVIAELLKRLPKDEIAEIREGAIERVGRVSGDDPEISKVRDSIRSTLDIIFTTASRETHPSPE